MKSRWLTTLSFALLVASAREQNLAASPKPAVPSPTAKAKKVKTPKPPKVKAAAKNKKSAIPTLRSADIPEVKEAASVRRGCLASGDLASFAFSFGVEESRLAPLLAEQGVPVTGNECVPYVAATGGKDGASSAILKGSEPGAGPVPNVVSNVVSNVDIRKTPDGITVTPGACDCPETLRRVLEFPVQDAEQAPGEVFAQVHGNVRWQLDTLMPAMLRRLAAKQGPVQSPSSQTLADASVLDATESHWPDSVPPEWSRASDSAVSGPVVRIVLARPDEYAAEHLQSIEILDPTTGRTLDGAWWLERNDSPGVFIGMEGVDYERLLWQSPVKYVHKSRGIGAAATTFTVRVAVPKGQSGKPKTRKVRVSEYHMGVDLIAAKGTEVHAVGEATVAFAGRNGGYGNLIILDHGLGYQTYYAHLSVIKSGIKIGAKVSRGDVVGLVGSTGRSTAPHLHFETRKDGKYIDPFDDTRQLEFWLLSPDDQERLGMEMLASSSSTAPRGEVKDHSQ